MLDARAALLDSGLYAPIANAVANAVESTFVGSQAGGAHSPTAPPSGPVQPRTPLSIADLGCGTGYYAAAVVARVPTARLLAADRSADAVRMTLRALGGSVDTTGVVLDLWRPLPLRDASADVLLDVFAPRNPAEYARVLAPGGALIVVVPTAAHLAGLRESAGMLDIPAGKEALVVEQFDAAGLRHSASVRVEYLIEPDAATRALIAGMGPSAHHGGTRGEVATPEVAVARTRPVAVSVDVLTLRSP